MKLSEIAKQVIDLAGATRDYWEAELPKRHPDFPMVHPGESSVAPPPEEVKLRKLLESLPEEALFKLVLVMHLGRGDFDTHELPRQYEEVKMDFEGREFAIAYLIGAVPSADHLVEGLVKLRESGLDIDKLPLKRVRQRT